MGRRSASGHLPRAPIPERWFAAEQRTHQQLPRTLAERGSPPPIGHSRRGHQRRCTRAVQARQRGAVPRLALCARCLEKIWRTPLAQGEAAIACMSARPIGSPDARINRDIRVGDEEHHWHRVSDSPRARTPVPQYPIIRASDLDEGEILADMPAPDDDPKIALFALHTLAHA